MASLLSGSMNWSHLGLPEPTGIPAPPPEQLRALADRVLSMGLDASDVESPPENMAPMHEASVTGPPSDSGEERGRALIDESALILVAVEKAMASYREEITALTNKVVSLTSAVESLTTEVSDARGALAEALESAEKDAETIARLRRAAEKTPIAPAPATTVTDPRDVAMAERLEKAVGDARNECGRLEALIEAGGIARPPSREGRWFPRYTRPDRAPSPVRPPPPGSVTPAWEEEDHSSPAQGAQPVTWLPADEPDPPIFDYRTPARIPSPPTLATPGEVQTWREANEEPEPPVTWRPAYEDDGPTEVEQEMNRIVTWRPADD